MPIDQLLIDNFRNLIKIQLNPQPGINIFYGQNGSGKTSLLEAIYFLGLGRSFRSHLIQRIIHQHAEQFLLLAQLKQDHQTISIGMERSRHGDKRIRLNGEFIHSLAPLAQHLPLQLLTSDSHRYFHEGPKPRRQFLDWGVFHVEHGFYPHWILFQKALKQKNAGLKSNLPYSQIEIWDREIIPLAHLFDQYRKKHVESLQIIFAELINSFLPEIPLHLRYSRGWPEDKNLDELLITHRIRDQQLGYTYYGPQRADLTVYTEKTPVSDILSQGQQKLAAYALHLAQGILLQRLINRSPIYLIDDLPSELDSTKRKFVAEILSKLQAQVFITAINLHDLSEMIPLNEAQLFHVEHGQITGSGL